MNAVVQPQRVSLIAKIAAKYAVDADKMLSTLKATAFKQDKNRDEVSNEQMMALLVVADQYDLNPFTKEIYAFPDKKGGIVPVVGVDGWSRIINSNPQFDGIEFIDAEQLDESDGHTPCPIWIECVIYRKDRSKPTKIRERFAECYKPPYKGKNKDTGGEFTVAGHWQTHTSRALRHKALIQCARIAFGYAGIYDPDEAERIRDAIDVTPAPAPKSGREATKAALGIKKPEPKAEEDPDEIATTIQAIRECGELDDLERMWTEIVASYAAAHAQEIPLAIEAAYKEHAEALEQAGPV